MEEKINAEIFIELFKDVIHDYDDYANNVKVRKHNKATKKIESLLEDIKMDKEYLSEMFLKLIDNEDLTLRQWVSSYCLRFNVLEEKAVDTLNYISENYKEFKFFNDLILKEYKKL